MKTLWNLILFLFIAPQPDVDMRAEIAYRAGGWDGDA